MARHEGPGSRPRRLPTLGQFVHAGTWEVTVIVIGVSGVVSGVIVLISQPRHWVTATGVFLFGIFATAYALRCMAEGRGRR